MSRRPFPRRNHFSQINSSARWQRLARWRASFRRFLSLTNDQSAGVVSEVVGFIKKLAAQGTLRRSTCQFQNSRRLVLEELEFRVMLSADALAFGDASDTFQAADFRVPPVDVNVSQLSSTETETHIAINPTNSLNMVIMANGGTTSANNQFIANTFDGGLTWTIRTLGPAQDGIGGANSDRFDGAVAFDAFGNMHAMYMARDSGTSAMIYAFSSDGGDTFNTQVLQAQAAGNDKPWIATGPDANAAGNEVVLVTYRNSTGLVARAATVSGLGVQPTFSAATTFSTNGNYAVPAVGPSGEFAITWQNPSGGESNGNVLFDRDLDGLVGGLAFGTDETITATQAGGFDFIPATPDRSAFASPYVAYDRSGGPFNGRLYVAYADESPDESDDFDIFVRHSDDNGSTWSAAVRVNDDIGTNSQFYQNISVDQTSGAVVLGWYDARNDSGGLAGIDTDNIANNDVQYFAAFSTDGGVSFGTNILVSDGASNQARDSNLNDFGDYTGIAAHAGVAHGVWVDNSNSTGDNPDGTARFDVYTDAFDVTLGNDDFVNAVDLGSVNSTAVTGSNVGFTGETGEPSQSGTIHSAWWSWTAPSTGYVIVDTNGSGFDTYLTMATGTAVDALTVIEQDDDDGAGNASLIGISVTGGTEYHFAIDGYLSNTGDITLNLDFTSTTFLGTSGDDIFVFNASGANYVATVNGASYVLDFSLTSKVIFSGLAGNDKITFVGGAQNETAVLRKGSLAVTKTGFNLNASSVETVLVNAGTGYDRAFLYDSANNDIFRGRKTYSEMTGAGFSNRATGFDQVYAFGNTTPPGGLDRAYLYDSSGNDTFKGRPTYSELSGSGFFNRATGFDQVYAYATTDAGGAGDRAFFYDSAGNDSFYGRKAYSYMTGSGFYNQANGFDKAYAYATAGNAGGIGDRANVYDSAFNDTFFGRNDYGRLTGNGYLIFAQGFERISAYANSGGFDTIDNRSLSYLFFPFGTWEKIL